MLLLSDTVAYSFFTMMQLVDIQHKQLEISISRLDTCTECPPSEQSHRSSKRNKRSEQLLVQRFPFLCQIPRLCLNTTVKWAMHILLTITPKKKKKSMFYDAYLVPWQWVCLYFLTFKTDKFVVESCITSDETLSLGTT